MVQSEHLSKPLSYAYIQAVGVLESCYTHCQPWQVLERFEMLFLAIQGVVNLLASHK